MARLQKISVTTTNPKGERKLVDVWFFRKKNGNIQIFKMKDRVNDGS